MQIHRVRGRDLRDALVRARTAHGEDAVVLSHEPLPGGGVTVSVTEVGGNEPTDTVALALEPGASDVARRLREAGASDRLTHEVIEAVRESGTHGAFAIDAAAAALAGMFSAAPSPQPTTATRVLAMVGPTGAGKTTTVAKLARRMTLAGRRVHVASLDTRRRGGSELLAGVCEGVRVPFTPVRYRQDLSTVLSEAGGADALLLDTVGRSPTDREHLEQLEDLLETCFPEADVTRYLVVSGASGRENLAEVLHGFGGVRPGAIVATKLDETRRTAVPLEFARESELPVAFLCTGQDVRGDIFRATPDRMADLVLGGRVR
jgi:flagellar biosynthesis protein FlhF